MKYDLNILNDYIAKGLVIGQSHATFPLAIFNYSRQCQYDKLWDEVTLNCRGLILDTKGNVVARPFPKFFNMEELSVEEIPNTSFDVFEKMDGSLGICFHYEGEWHMATRGSFTSEQAIKGKEMLDKYDTSKLNTHYTYLFEIIYKENRIVVDYDFEDLVLLAVIDTDTGAELSLDYVNTHNFRVVKKYNGISDFKILKTMIGDNSEGYVIRFNGGMRMKIKGEEYVRLHRILTNFSTTDIWELLRTKGNINEFLDRVPDEFDNWVRLTMTSLEAEYENIRFRSWMDYEYHKFQAGSDKKSFANAIKDNEYRSILFAMWDGKSYEDTIWKMVKPKWSKPFKKDLDN